MATRGDAAAANAPGAGSVVLNVMWLVLSGFWLFLAYVFAGIIQLCTIIGIPFGIQSFKLAGFALWPFGRMVVRRPGASIWLALGHAVIGVLLCCTIIGIPLGMANFKLIPLALTPFGRDIVKKGSAAAPGAISF
jgi:uncharacterized membrane protein YccF (DUF307 family)